MVGGVRWAVLWCAVCGVRCVACSGWCGRCSAHLLDGVDSVVRDTTDGGEGLEECRLVYRCGHGKCVASECGRGKCVAMVGVGKVK